jgi:uncharacterized protein YbjQ (UPF0145 family)
MSGDAVAGLVFGLLCVGLVLLLVLAIPLYSILVGFHRRSKIKEQLAHTEPQLQQLVQTNTEAAGHAGSTALALGTVAYAADGPSRLATQWRSFFGGQAVSLTEQADLARRLAIVRMLEQARGLGAIGVANVRVETSEIFSGQGRNSAMVIELLAYGTALLPAAEPPQPPAQAQQVPQFLPDEPTRVRPPAH